MTKPVCAAIPKNLERLTMYGLRDRYAIGPTEFKKCALLNPGIGRGFDCCCRSGMNSFPVIFQFAQASANIQIASWTSPHYSRNSHTKMPTHIAYTDYCICSVLLYGIISLLANMNPTYILSRFLEHD
jgi:hypothetical protein